MTTENERLHDENTRMRELLAKIDKRTLNPRMSDTGAMSMAFDIHAMISPLNLDDLDVEPKQPGWYAYSGGRNALIFLLDAQGTWHVISDNGETDLCVWGYIEQALGVWDLNLLLPLGGDEK